MTDSPSRAPVWQRTALCAAALAASGIVWYSVSDIDGGALPHDWQRAMPQGMLILALAFSAFVIWGNGPRWALVVIAGALVVTAATYALVMAPWADREEQARAAFAAYTARIKPLAGGEIWVRHHARNGPFSPGDVMMVCRASSDESRDFCATVDLREPQGSRVSDADWWDRP